MVIRYSGTRRDTNPRHFSLTVTILFALIVLSAIGTVLASTIQVPATNLAVGSDNVEFCATGTNIQYGLRLTTTGETVIDSIQIAGIPTSCAGQHIALGLYNSSGTLLDEVVWELVARPGDTSITAIADESTTSASNTSLNSASLSYPASQTDPEGLATAITANQISRTELLNLPVSRSARE